MQKDLRIIGGIGAGALVALLLTACHAGPKAPTSEEQQATLQQIIKASDEGTMDGRAAAMAFENRDLAMACHFWQRSISGIDRMEQLMSKLPADSQAKLTGIQGLVNGKPRVVAAYSSVCPQDQQPSP